MSIVIGIVVAFALALGYVRATQWAKEVGRTRFAFENRETFLYLKLSGPLGHGEAALMTMQALREALLLKTSGMNSGQALVDVSGLRISSARAFWLLVGGLGPLLLNEGVNVAVVSPRRSRAARLLVESGILICLPSVREGERHLQSGQPRPPMVLDEAYVSGLLTLGRRKAA